MSLAKLLLDHDMPDDIGKVTSEHIRAFLLARAWADVASVRPSASQEPPHLLPADRDRGGAAGTRPHGQGGETSRLSRWWNPPSPKPRLQPCCGLASPRSWERGDGGTVADARRTPDCTFATGPIPPWRPIRHL